MTFSRRAGQNLPRQLRYPSRPAQARPGHRRRLPPAGLPRGHGEGPLPAPPGVHDPRPQPARDPQPAVAPTGLLHPETITAGPQIAAKTRQKHDYPSQAWRLSYRRRTAAERLNAGIKDTATGSIDRGWIRLTGITPLMLWLACLIVVRNQRTLAACQARQHDTRHAASHQQPRARKRRRELAGAATGPP